MAKVIGSQVLGRSLRRQGVDTMFFLMGGPMLDTESSCIEEGIRSIDVRHEQAAAMMAHAWGRLVNKPGICMAASGPATTNLVTGVGNAWADGVPLLALGGAAPLVTTGRGIFQECDQLSIFKPITKWADRVLDARRIPEMVATALRQAQTGRRGPTYLDMPGDVLYKEVEEDDIVYPEPFDWRRVARPMGDPSAVKAAIKLLSAAERPIIVSGSGVLWSEAMDEMKRFVEASGIPFFTTPQGRGVVPDDHELSFLAARNTAFREADLIFVLATRMNYVSGHFTAPRFSPDAKLIQVDIDPGEIGLTRPADAGIVGDAKMVLQQLLDEGKGQLKPSRYKDWVDHLRQVDQEKSAQAQARMNSDAVPIHPLRLCKEVSEFLDRDAVLVVDGQEILNFGRQSIPTYTAGHRLNSGAWGTMGVGLPFGLGAKVARPDKQVLVLHGDGSFGLNAMELDTAVRHKIPVVCVVSLNGGWTADPDGTKPGRQLGYTRYDKMAEALGCHAEFVEEPSEIKPALDRAFKSGIPALVNVKTDYRARASTTKFSVYST
jgi:thiamine pyrophosphate-dependent acetolactate synthase large subunit-like protein